MLRGGDHKDLHKNLLDRVQSLPKNIEDLYHDVLERTDEIYRRQQLAVLVTMLYVQHNEVHHDTLPAVLINYLHKDEAQAL